MPTSDVNELHSSFMDLDSELKDDQVRDETEMIDGDQEQADVADDNVFSDAYGQDLTW